jgi:hypothetical protein
MVGIPVTRLTRISEAPGSNLGRDTGYSEIFMVFRSHSKQMPR